MEQILILVAAAAGALVGTSAGLLILRRKLQLPITDTELAELKGNLQNSESSLTAASANLADLRKQIVLQEGALRQNSDDLKKKQGQLDIESVEREKEKARRSAAEQGVQELSTKTGLLADECRKLEARVKEESSLAAGKAARLAAVDAELETGKRKTQELIEQVARLTSESLEYKRCNEQETRFRTALEAQLTAEQERIRQMTSQIAELQNERTQLEVRFHEERRSATKGMELLLSAQVKLSSVFKALGVDGQNGLHSEAPVEIPVANPEAKTETVEVVQAVSSSS